MAQKSAHEKLTALRRVSAKKSPIYGEAGYQRLPDDAYFTPVWVTKALLDFIKFPQMIWEPAAGNGAMSEVIKQYYDKVIYSDINAQDFNYGKALDFLKVNNISPEVRSIITNPPYNLAEEFINKALQLMRGRSAFVAMLLRNEYDSAATRRYLFEKAPFYAKLILTKRPLWVANGASSPRHNFAWFVWKMDYRGYPTIHYLPKT